MLKTGQKRAISLLLLVAVARISLLVLGPAAIISLLDLAVAAATVIPLLDLQDLHPRKLNLL
jgi:hypothetical protein